MSLVPIAAGAYPSFCSMKPPGVLLLLLDASPSPVTYSISSGFPDSLLVAINLYSWVERVTVRVKCLSQEHNEMTRARH